MKYFLSFVAALIIVYFLIPPLRKLAIRIDFVDRPTSRKIHEEPVPHLAGIAIFAGFILTYFCFAHNFSRQSVAVLIGSILILSIGIIDDWFKTHGRDFPAFPKFVVQALAAVIVYYSGIVFTGFNHPFNDTYVVLPKVVQCVLSVTWIFGVTTVINFVDGLDGLAGGISAISALTLFVVALAKGQADSALMAIILVGAALGYLQYNKFPAKVYMGDAGATFLGFILGIISLGGAFKQATVLSLFIPILALGVPILDNIYVVIKRILEGKPAHIADRSQVHYRLLSTGLKPKQVVTVLYLVSICFSLTSIVLLLLKI